MRDTFYSETSDDGHLYHGMCSIFVFRDLHNEEEKSRYNHAPLDTLKYGR